MSHLGFTSSCADLDVWFGRVKQTSGEEYYEYVLLYWMMSLLFPRELLAATGGVIKTEKSFWCLIG